MKFTRAEKIWLAVVVILFILYNLPFVPKYDNAVGTLVHGALTLIPLWIAVYVGLFKVSKSYKDEKPADTTEDASCTEMTGGDGQC